MKSFLTLLIISSSFVFGQKNNASLNKMVSTEFAFAKYAEEYGTRDAFLKFIADDGILFRPDAVTGKYFLVNSKSSSTKSILSWYPTYAEISNAGDLGFTTGPWEYRKAKDSAAIAFGNFMTVWELQKDGNWKFAIDYGNSNAKPTIKLIPLEFTNDKKAVTNDMKNYASSNADELIELDRKFSDQIKKDGLINTYQQYIAKTGRLLRDDEYPIIGTEQISKYLSKLKATFSYGPTAGKISSSGDLGFTYGILFVKESEESQNFNYVRFWKKENGSWKIYVDAAGELPEGS